MGATEEAIRAQQAGDPGGRMGGSPVPGVGAMPSAGTGGGSYIGGFDEGYKATRKVGGGSSFGMGRLSPWKKGPRTQKLAPQYRQGDEWKPLKNNWTPGQIADLQRKMVAAGLLKKGSFQLGRWDPASRAAYEELLTEANASGRDSTTTLMSMMANRELLGGDAEARMPLQLEVTHPDDIRAMVRATDVKVLGRKLSDGEAEEFVNLFQERQRAYQRQMYEMQGSGSNDPATWKAGELAAPPSLDSFTEAEIRRRHPAEAGAHDITDSYGEFLSLLGEGG